MSSTHNQECDTDQQLFESRSRLPRRMVLVEWRDEIVARLLADFANWGIDSQRVSWPGQLARVSVCRQGTLIVINGDQPFEGDWLLACKLRVACPDAKFWLYRVAVTREDRLAESLCAADALIAYGGDLLRLSQRLGERLAAMKPGEGVGRLTARRLGRLAS